MTIYSWEDATSPDFKPLEDTTGWLACPRCQEHPRTWVFDNGNYARCRCAYWYQSGGAEALSFGEAHKRGISYSEYKQLLRIAWNKHVSTLSPQPTPTTPEDSK